MDTAVVFATRNGQEVILAELIRLGAQGRREFLYCNTVKFVGCIQLPVQVGASVNTPNVVTNLASFGCSDSLPVLMEMGADVNSCLPYLETAASWAVMKGKMVLIHCGVKINLRNRTEWQFAKYKFFCLLQENSWIMPVLHHFYDLVGN